MEGAPTQTPHREKTRSSRDWKLKRGVQLTSWCIKPSGFKKTIILLGYNSVGSGNQAGLKH